MSEISREEAKEILLQICYDGEFPNDSSLAFNKAISDMEKLEKIEKYIEEQKCDISCIECDIDYCDLHNIELIVKQTKS